MAFCALSRMGEMTAGVIVQDCRNGIWCFVQGGRNGM